MHETSLKYDIYTKDHMPQGIRKRGGINKVASNALNY